MARREEDANLLDELLDMDIPDLREFVEMECKERGIGFDIDILESGGLPAFYEFIGSRFYASEGNNDVLPSEHQHSNTFSTVPTADNE